MSKVDKTLEYLRTHKSHSISNVEAIAVFGNFRLSSTIASLRDKGHLIDTDLKVDAAGKNYSRYVLASA